jgi:hypothetical protein
MQTYTPTYSQSDSPSGHEVRPINDLFRLHNYIRVAVYMDVNRPNKLNVYNRCSFLHLLIANVQPTQNCVTQQYIIVVEQS